MSDAKIYRLNFLMQKKMKLLLPWAFCNTRLNSHLYIGVGALAELFFCAHTG
jgi:hypothetical protein